MYHFIQQFNYRKNLNNLGIITDTNTSKIIRNLINNQYINTHIKSRAGVFEILDCNETYLGQTSLNINKRIYEERRDLKRVNINNSLVNHNLETNHYIIFKDSKMLVLMHDKKTPKIIESSVLSYHKRNAAFSISHFIWSDWCWEVKKIR